MVGGVSGHRAHPGWRRRRQWRQQPVVLVGGLAHQHGVREGGRVPRLRTPLQAEEFAAQPPEVGVRQGSAVPVPVLQLPSQAEDARGQAHRAYAPREADQHGGDVHDQQQQQHQQQQ